MALANYVVYGFVPYLDLQTGDRVEIRNFTKKVASTYKVAATSASGDGWIQTDTPISILMEDGDVVVVRRLDENEEFPVYSHAMIGVPGSLSFNRKDMRILADMIGHISRPLIAIEEA